MMPQNSNIIADGIVSSGPTKPQHSPPASGQHTPYPSQLTVAWGNTHIHLRTEKQNNIMPKPLDFQALWFLFCFFIKGRVPLLPLLFQSVVNPARETSKSSQQGLGRPTWAWACGRRDRASGWSSFSAAWVPRPGLFLSFLLAWEREVRFTMQAPQQKQCASMNPWKTTHFSHQQVVL